MQLLRHVNNRDVAIQIIRSFYVPEKLTYKFTVYWWNIGACHAPWSMGIREKIEVSKSQMSDWKPYKEM